MEGAAFEIELGRARAGPDGRRRASSSCIAPNAGVPAGAAARDRVGRRAVAGDARAHGACAERRAPRGATLVFDEVDAGIGGQTARAVGEQLRALAERGQVVCITHLPQVASLADRHFSIAKDSVDGAARARPSRELSDAEVVAELVRMLGADERDDGARRHAEELLRAA